MVCLSRSRTRVQPLGVRALLLLLLAMTSSVNAVTKATTCEMARLKCAYRMGCGMALQNYLVNCADIMSGRVKRCSDMCKKALIALTSTEEGKGLMVCDCEGQEFCEETKRRIEVCRPEVMRANEEDSVVSCSVAQWICMADPLCSTAVDYYKRLCRSMFHGRKCTLRCNNSIAILNRQEKAAKLKTCVCDGTEDYDCRNIKLNMDRLCFHKPNPLLNPQHDNEVRVNDAAASAVGSRGGVSCSRATPTQALSLTLVVLAFLLSGLR